MRLGHAIFHPGSRQFFFFLHNQFSGGVSRSPNSGTSEKTTMVDELLSSATHDRIHEADTPTAMAWGWRVMPGEGIASFHYGVSARRTT